MLSCRSLSGKYVWMPSSMNVSNISLALCGFQLDAGASPEVFHGLSHATPEQLAQAFYFLDAAKVLKHHKVAAEKNAAKEDKVCPPDFKVVEPL